MNPLTLFTRRQFCLLLLVLLLPRLGHTQTAATPYPGLVQPADAPVPLYCTPGTEARAAAMAARCAAALKWMQQPAQLGFAPRVTMLVLGKADWARYAGKGQVLGMPHTNGPAVLVVAGEDNELWQHTLPPTDQLPAALAQRVKTLYRTPTGQLSAGKMFDLTVVHELAHLAYRQARLNRPRYWLEEQFCNLLLHTFIASQEPAQLPALETFPEAVVQGTDRATLKYTSLADFDRYYNLMEREQPMLYGWYQCRLHRAAARIYDAQPDGPHALHQLWVALKDSQATYTDAQLADMLRTKVSPELAQVLTNW
ncbi:hypothetical protein [Hymenobacter properus]|uniref:Peptidase MA-like domain-containing protein n=1 Tax=Hymenobacter properus TaxID=2791026 RepID=A0A931FJJ7_9BACT|nr:hypothetical protein [Hymenobacter properus]MBF9140610.1 hypothetical protein [Hymenobacter properus]MBR7719418.1 hypothetical protein [Microvirga sp. SRT04]